MNFFESAYEGTPPWDIGHPQGEIVRLAQAGAIKGSVLDVGCGTGENVLYLALLGHEAWGVDAAPSAIKKARAKALQRKLAATFVVGDVLELKRLGRRFDTIIDTGLFHTLEDAERPRFVRSLSAALRRDGRYYLMCFSEYETGPGGPRRITQAEIRATFRRGWSINSIQAARFESNLHPDGAKAWLASLTCMSGGDD